MKRIASDNLEEGLVIAADIYINGTQLLIPKGVVLTKNIINLIRMNHVLNIKVEDTAVEQKIKEETSYLERIRSSNQFSAFQKDYEANVQKFSKCMNDLVEKNMPFDTNQFLEQILNMLSSSDHMNGILDFLIAMRNYDDSTFCHSVNVSLLCGLFADWLHLSPGDKEIAILSGLFHDVGKLKIPESIIKKPNKLTEKEFSVIKKHSELGYALLRQKSLESMLNEHVRNAALMHHEKCDGSGYPLGLVLNQIDFFAKMVSIVDVYDAMTSARVYRKPLCPFTVISHFEDEGLQKYDPELLLVFLDHVVNTYINHTVKLSNGQIGNIIFINKVNLSKPTVKCQDEYVDLAKRSDVHIENLI